MCEFKCLTELFKEFTHLRCEMSVGKRVQKLIECLLVELIVFGVLNFLWISHLHGGNRNQLSVFFISPYSLGDQSDHKYQKGAVLSMKQTGNSNSRLTHMGFVSLASSQSQYFSVTVFFFFFFSPYMSKYNQLQKKQDSTNIRKTRSHSEKLTSVASSPSFGSSSSSTCQSRGDYISEINEKIIRINRSKELVWSRE